MITIKKEKKDEMKKYNFTQLAKITGLTYPTVYNTLVKGKSCSKMTAYVLVKTFNENAEIDDYFDRS